MLVLRAEETLHKERGELTLDIIICTSIAIYLLFTQSISQFKLFFQVHNTYIYNMSGNSSVGNSNVYEAGDQVTRSNAEIEQEKKENRFHEGKENSHKALDSSMCFPHQLHVLMHFWSCRARLAPNSTTIMSTKKMLTAAGRGRAINRQQARA